MKHIIIFLMLALVNQVNAQITKAEITATGLTCSMCSNAINKQLKSIAEIDSVQIDLNTNTFIVFLKKGNTLAPNIFKEKVEKAGFFIGSFVVTTSPEILGTSNYILLGDKPNSQTEIKFQVLDKGYVTEKEFKKLSKNYKSVETYADKNENNFHLKIIK